MHALGIAPVVPDVVLAFAKGRSVRPVWRNALGGLTFELGEGEEREFIKWAPAHSGLDLAAEMARLNWAVQFACVPRVLAHGADRGGAWLLTRALPGDNAVSERWRNDPATRPLGGPRRPCWSTTWNYGPGWSEALLAAYGVAPDPRRMAYYRLLWDLGP